MKLNGTSRSGMGTTLHVPEHRLCLDMGAPLLETVGTPTVLVTHGHVDHTAAMVYHASTRDMMGMGPSNFFVPQHDVEAVQEFLEAAIKMNGGSFRYLLTATAEGHVWGLSKNRFFECFPTDHRVPSLGYKVYTIKSKLKEELVGLPGEELQRLRVEEGVELSRPVTTLALSYVGDSRVTVLEAFPEVLQAKVLVMETTFVGDYPLEETHERGHTHLSELAERAELFKDVETLVLTHFSMRHSEAEVRDEVAKLPDSLREKVQLVF